MEKIKSIIKKALQKSFPKKKWDSFKIELEIPPSEQLGDIAFPCFSLAEKLNLSPNKIAQDLERNIQKGGIVKEVKTVGPYLNLFFNKKLFAAYILRIILQKKHRFGLSNIGQGKTIMVEYSSPNANKPQHLGHIRNNLIGMTISNLLEAIGYKVIRANLVNDRGIHICKSMLAYLKWGNGKTPESEGIKGDHFIGNFYVLFEKKHKEQVEQMKAEGKVERDLPESEVPTPLLQEARELLRKWEKGDPEVVALWKKMTDWVMKGFMETYNRMGVKFDKWYFESKTYKLGKEIVLEALKKGLCYQKPDGAIAIDLTKYGLDEKILLRADGTSVYITQDIGTAVSRFKEFNLNKLIYVVASEQEYHFKALFTILKLFGYKWAKNCYHLNYGMVHLPHGRMKSREGTVVDADDLMDELKQMALQRILSKNTKLSKNDLDKLADIIGLGALKFFILKISPQKDIKFDPASSLQIEGATGPYIQYTYARVNSVLKKAPKIYQDNSSKPDLGLLSCPEEFQIIKIMAQWPEVVMTSAQSYNPSYVCLFLLSLARAFNEFYQKYRVIDAKNKDLTLARLYLVKSVKIVLENGLKILGIEAPKKM